MNFRFYYVFILASLCAGPRLAAQKVDWPGVIFRDISVFERTTRRQAELSGKYLLIDKTVNFQAEQIRKDTTAPFTGERYPELPPPMSDSMRNVLKSIFTEQYIAAQKRTINPIPIPPDRDLYELIDTSITKPDSSFYFAISEPIFNKNRNYIYVELRTYRPEEDMDLWQQVFTETMLIYRFTKEKGWTRFFQFDYHIQ